MGLDRDDPVVRRRIAGLCERLDVDPRIHELITYIYALLDNDADGSLDSTRVILQKAMAPENLSARQTGVQEAEAIVKCSFITETRYLTRSSVEAASRCASRRRSSAGTSPAICNKPGHLIRGRFATTSR